MTETQRQDIERLVNNGQLAKLPLNEFRALSEAKAEEYITKGYATAPLTHAAATKEQKDSLRSYISQRLLPLKPDDTKNLTSAEANFLLDFATEKSFNAEQGYTGTVTRMESDTELATEKQIKMIKSLVEKGYLEPVSTENLVSMSKLTARKLIFKGEIKKRGGK